MFAGYNGWGFVFLSSAFESSNERHEEDFQNHRNSGVLSHLLKQPILGFSQWWNFENPD
jgi:hypothetical protein